MSDSRKNNNVWKGKVQFYLENRVSTQPGFSFRIVKESDDEIVVVETWLGNHNGKRYAVSSYATYFAAFDSELFA